MSLKLRFLSTNKEQAFTSPGILIFHWSALICVLQVRPKKGKENSSHKQRAEAPVYNFAAVVAYTYIYAASSCDINIHVMRYCYSDKLDTRKSVLLLRTRILNVP
jgi:hypothetical protein